MQFVLLIENTVPISSDFNFPYIIFDRVNPVAAVINLNNKITALKTEPEQNQMLGLGC